MNLLNSIYTSQVLQEFQFSKSLPSPRLVRQISYSNPHGTPSPTKKQQHHITPSDIFMGFHPPTTTSNISPQNTGNRFPRHSHKFPSKGLTSTKRKFQLLRKKKTPQSCDGFTKWCWLMKNRL